MGDEKEGQTQEQVMKRTYLKDTWTKCSGAMKRKGRRQRSLRERETRAVLSTVVPRKSTRDRIYRRMMAWLREIGLEFVDIHCEFG